jgi:hypothetical protein
MSISFGQKEKSCKSNINTHRSDSIIVYSGNMLWDIKGEKCYLDLIDKSTFYIHYKHIEKPRTDYERYYCTAKISNKGIEMTFNNTCDNKFSNWESGEQLAYDMVGKYQTGFYTFNGRKWVISAK